MAYRDSPARVLECFVVNQIGLEAWPFQDGDNDPFWKFGTTPRDYQWRVEIEVQPQHHSSYRTRVPRLFNGMDVRVGDYIANTADGMAVKIVCVEAKTDSLVTCIVEDEFRYNMFRDPSGMGNGLMTVPSRAIIFSLNDKGLPLVDPLPAAVVESQFYPNLMSRFQTAEIDTHFLVNAHDHGFTEGQVLSTSAVDNGFVLTDDTHPIMVGRVTNVPSQDAFFVSMSQNVLDNLDYLPGDVGDIIYADADAPSGLTTAANLTPVMVKLRNNSASVATGTIPASLVTNGSGIAINGETVIVSGIDRIALVDSINGYTAQTGITASIVALPTFSRTLASNLHPMFGEALLDLTVISPVASFNGISVTFTTTDDGMSRYGMAYSTPTDMAQDINHALSGALVATVEGGSLKVTNPTGAAITILNISSDSQNHNFAGPGSASGLQTNIAANPSNLVRLTAPDARAIDIADISGSTLADYGLVSVENGTKAAAIFVDAGSYAAEDGDGRADITITQGTNVSTLAVIGTITRLTLIIITPFTGPLAIKSGSTTIMDAANYDPTQAGIYEVLTAVSSAAPVSAITTGAGSGSAKLIVEYLAT